MNHTALKPLPCLLLVVASSLLSATAHAAPIKKETLPPALREWTGWVLYSAEAETCPKLDTQDVRECAWPGRLSLSLERKGGRFTQSAQMFGAEGWLPLPGSVQRWPQQVQVDGRSAIVIDREGLPAVRLPAGTHTITGTFEWDTLPEAIDVPLSTGLLALTVQGGTISQPSRDEQGRVFLQREVTEQESDQVELAVNRLVTDSIPLTLTTQLQLNVSGKSRELLLGRALPEDFVPMSVASPFPLRIEPDGTLRAQVRPGTWVITIVARREGTFDTLRRPAVAKGLWAEADETWVFEARPSFRQVLIEGVNGVDPQQTTLPSEWKRLPAYAMGPKDVMQLTQRRRGDSDPAPDALRLSRTLWLDFEGTGFTVSDSVTGQLHRSWRLDMQPGTELGRVVASGADQSITRLTPQSPAGVELRQGSLTLEADSRIAGPTSTISAVSWDADFDSVSTTLQLPPGWSLISASGADSVPGTWVARWSLLDIFLVLVITLTIGRLFGVPWGALAFVTLVLTWHEEDVPRFIWLAVLSGEALMRVLPESWFKTVMRFYRLVTWGTLLVISTSFMVDHVRHGMYPALAQSRELGGVSSYSEYSTQNAAQYLRSSGNNENQNNQELVEGGEQDELKLAFGSAADALQADRPAPKGGSWQGLDGSNVGAGVNSRAQANQAGNFKKRSLNVRDYDKNAMVQTGPGLPRWEWQRLSIDFSGPVQRAQQISFLLIGPRVNFVLAFVRVLLLACLLLCVLGFPGAFWPPGVKRMLKTGAPTAGLLLALAFGLHSGSAMAGGDEGDVPGAAHPNEDILAELKTRLLAPNDCEPSCASIPRLMLEASPATLRMRLEVLAALETAVPLPGHAQHWSPDSVMLDGKAASGLRRDESGVLWLVVTEGAHQVIVEGALPERDTVQIGLPLGAHHVEAKVTGWTLDGLHEDGIADENLQLSRESTNDKRRATALQMGTLPPFVQIKRELSLGLTWSVETTVTRLTPTGSAVVLEVPLLPGESVTTSELRVQNGKALVNMPAGETNVQWSSVLETKSPIQLVALKSVPWVELWRLDVSPVWHVHLSGIPVIHQQDSVAVRLPEWRPWPGETLTVEVVRPEGVAGQTLTIDQSSMNVTPGVRTTDVYFTANMRSSRGGLHPFTLPEDATLTSVTINGAQQPIRQEGRTVSIPLVPGSQSVVLVWQQSSGQSASWQSPSLEVGTSTVNASLMVRVPSDRWVLFLRGPRMGPAVLFWSFLLVLLLVSIGLGRIRWTPLSTLQWVLLALGLSQVPIAAIAVVFGWLVLLGHRNQTLELTRGWFNLRQLFIVGATGVALIIIGVSVYQGLLGQPEMQIRGNGSGMSMLRWFQDRTDTAFPTAWVVSLPMNVYRLAMLAWSLWMALALLRWLTWGWKAFANGGLWKAQPPKVAPPAPPSSTVAS